MTIDPVSLLQDLVRCDSVSAAGAAAAQDIVAGHLRRLGFECQTLSYNGTSNLFARRGTDGPHLGFSGHTDVVPAGDPLGWTYPPFDGRVADGKVYGRGTADMKAQIACFMAALSQYLTQGGGARGSISFLLTGDEETGSANGAVPALRWLKEKEQIPDVVIVGEPSNPVALGDEIKIGRRGSLCGVLTVQGKQGHVAYPDRAKNPLPPLIKLLNALETHEFDQGTPYFPPTNFEMTSIDVGNPADNVIPAQGSAAFNLRFNDLWSVETLSAKIRALLDAVDTGYEIEFYSNADSFMTQPGPFTDLFIGAIREVTGRVPALGTGGGTTDARFVSKYAPVVEFGLINKTIHQTDEHVAIDDMMKLTEIYRLVLERYFAV